MRGENVTLHAGFFTERSIRFRRGNIRAIIIQQPLFMVLIRHSSAHLVIAGYGKDQGEQAVLIPSMRSKDISKQIKQFIPDFPLHTHVLLRAPRTALGRVCGAPCMWTAGSILMGLGGEILFQDFSHLWFFLCSTAAVFFLLWLCVRLLAYQRGGLCTQGTYWAVTGPKRLTLFTAVVKQQNIGVMTIRQSSFARKDGICSLTLSLSGESGRKMKLPWVSYQEAAALCTSRAVQEIE